MWCFARFDIICAILKNVKNTHEGVILLVKLQALAINIPLWVFFTFFKFYKLKQIAQRIPDDSFAVVIKAAGT